ncbi:MAG: hypothetical protein RR565_08320 [Erysipelothrix sp.]
MTRITVNRSWNFMGMARAYKIYINDKEIGRVKNNESVTLDIEPGTYAMRVGISKLSGMSNILPIYVEEGDDLAFTTQMSMYLIIGFVMAFIGGGMVGLFSAANNIALMLLGFAIVIVGIIGATLNSIKLKQTI